MLYQHTQIGRLTIVVLLAIIILFGVILTQPGLEPTMLIIMILIILLLTSFTALNVIIDEKYLKIKFGWGILKKRFELKKITSAEIVRNHWYYGWGIRLWLWPQMLIFNVSGFDAVEIKMTNGKIYRIGTDDPKNLETVLIKAIKR